MMVSGIDVVDAIQSLGRTLTDAETRLVKKKARGVPGCVSRCLLANYFGKVLRTKGVTVDQEQVYVGDREYDLPRHLADLVWYFDNMLADRRLYPLKVKWTPPMKDPRVFPVSDVEWQYRFWPIKVVGLDDALLVDSACPYRISCRLHLHGRSYGYQVFDSVMRTKLYTTPSEALESWLKQSELEGNRNMTGMVPWDNLPKGNV